MNNELSLTRISNPTRTRAILERHGFHFKKKFGQNFLTDGNVLDKIVEVADVADCNVIEIGPGIGALTQILLEEASQVMAFEIDEALIPILEEELADYPNLILRQQDVLKANLTQEIAAFDNPQLPLKVVANLPYYITTPILMGLLESEINIAGFTVMMQKEVAARMSAGPGTKDYGQLTLTVQYSYEATIAFDVPRTVFVPQPNVDSAILQLVKRPQALVEVSDEAWFFKVIKICFVHRRKTLLNNLTLAFGGEKKTDILAGLEASDIVPERRAESLTIDEFARLAENLKRY
ncbi:MAG: 16S rRNA (adenine(1518)-N(6)/adenine(1519)-N(6))-dimethyltransferase RsmA [Streptococcaceae bacterium]|jgi:16S rRNA (adenine1518-N6/adenine1519-N6)-dimethyltransferase|nr:16S rRNA (adenine(1518)-N(6)/adenine(1519)-N(6))-dimethyltransferase RsmA [Streptococcaceae bacterium]